MRLFEELVLNYYFLSKLFDLNELFLMRVNFLERVKISPGGNFKISKFSQFIEYLIYYMRNELNMKIKC